MSALCVTRPADWWDTGHDGNRLALAMCAVCTAKPRCPQGDPQPHGVIRAGVAYADTGLALPVCHCGYPQTNYRGGWRFCCPWCTTRPFTQRLTVACRTDGADEQAVDRLMSGQRPEVVRLVDLRAAIARLFAAGLSNREVAQRLGMTLKAVRRRRQRMREVA